MYRPSTTRQGRAKIVVSETITKHGIVKDQLTLQSDWGSPMTAKPFVFLLADLGVTRSYSRPHTSNDNPYSESRFRTMKYRPEFPDRFGCFEDAHAWCSRFFRWYNGEHRHSGIGYHTPATSTSDVPAPSWPWLFNVNGVSQYGVCE